MMEFFRLPKSPMSVLPGAKQLRTIWFVLAGFLAASGVLCVFNGRDGNWLALAECVLSAAAAVLHVRTFCRKAVGSVMSFFPTTCLLAALRVLFKLIGIPSRFGEGTESPLVLLLIIEILFWAAFCLCTYFALMGKAKLMLPLAMLLFAFFYVFVEFELRNFLEIARLILFLLLLWFPIDAVSFTSFPDRMAKKRDGEEP